MTDKQLKQAMSLLGLTPEDFWDVTPAALRDLQKRAKLAYKDVVLQYHPDKTGGDPKKTEIFRHVTDVLAEISDLKYPVEPRPKVKLSKMTLRLVL